MVICAPLTVEAFALFGDVLSAPEQPGRRLFRGRARKHWRRCGGAQGAAEAGARPHFATASQPRRHAHAGREAPDLRGPPRAGDRHRHTGDRTRDRHRPRCAAQRAQLRLEHETLHRAPHHPAQRIDQPAWACLASSFHLRLAELADQPLLHRYLVETVSRCSLTLALHQPPGNAACEHDEHERIVEDTAARDGAGAVAPMVKHRRDPELHLPLDAAQWSRSLAHLLGRDAAGSVKAAPTTTGRPLAPATSGCPGGR